MGLCKIGFFAFFSILICARYLEAVCANLSLFCRFVSGVEMTATYYIREPERRARRSAVMSCGAISIETIYARG